MVLLPFTDCVFCGVLFMFVIYFVCYGCDCLFDGWCDMVVLGPHASVVYFCCLLVGLLCVVCLFCLFEFVLIKDLFTWYYVIGFNSKCSI